MCERAALKSSVRIIRGAHLLWGYCGDNLSEARPRIGDLRCTRNRPELPDREDRRRMEPSREKEVARIPVWQGRTNRYSLLAQVGRQPALYLIVL